MKIEHILYHSDIEKTFRCSILFDFVTEESERYKSYSQNPETGKVTIYPYHNLIMSRSYEDRIFIPTRRYSQFIILLERSIKLISEHLYELYPNVTKNEFEIDHKTLEIFQTERALSIAGMTMIPDIFVNEVSETFPAVHISMSNGSTFKLTLNDAMGISKILNIVDPYNLGLSLLRTCGKIQ